MPAKKNDNDMLTAFSNMSKKTPSGRISPVMPGQPQPQMQQPPASETLRTPMQQPGQPSIRANWLKDLGSAFEKNITKPIREGVDKYIGQPLTEAGKTIKRGTGFEAAPVPESAKPKVDPGAAAAMAKYGQMVTGQAGQFNPEAYGQDYFKARTYTPQITTGTQGMPGIYTQRQAPNVPGQVATPELQNVGGQNLQLRDVGTGTGLNLYGQQAALRGEMQRFSTPTNLAEGYDQGLRQTYVDLATSGLEQQKQESLARMKEEQMKAGNYGSSVGQKAMQDLISDYDRQIIAAGKEADIMQAEAAREDRYRNIGVEQSRAGLVGSLAGQGANLEIAGKGYARDTASLQNQAELLRQEFERQGIQIDNETAMQMAQFGAGQSQQDFSNRMAAAQFGREGDIASYESDWRRYLTGQEQKQIADAIQNQAQQFNIGQGDVADVRNYGAYQDMLRNLAGYGSNQFTPESTLAYEQWLRQQQQQAQKMGNAIGLVGQFIP